MLWLFRAADIRIIHGVVAMISHCKRLLLWAACSGFFVWSPWHLAKFMKVGKSLLGNKGSVVVRRVYGSPASRMKVVGKLRTGL